MADDYKLIALVIFLALGNIVIFISGKFRSERDVSTEENANSVLRAGGNVNRQPSRQTDGGGHEKLVPRSSSWYDDVSLRMGNRDRDYRDLIGGFWDEIGTLQFEMLKSHGLKPEHYLLDMGCGALRGGIKVLPYLQAGHYYGVDINHAFLEAGYKNEVMPLDFSSKLPRHHLQARDDFDAMAAFNLSSAKFDYAISVSLMTHLSLDVIRECLRKVMFALKCGARYYTTMFVVPQNWHVEKAFPHSQWDFSTYFDRDPYHVKVSQIELLVQELGLSMEYLGDWKHPRGQKLFAFSRNC